MNFLFEDAHLYVRQKPRLINAKPRKKLFEANDDYSFLVKRDKQY